MFSYLKIPGRRKRQAKGNCASLIEGTHEYINIYLHNSKKRHIKFFKNIFLSEWKKFNSSAFETAPNASNPVAKSYSK